MKKRVIVLITFLIITMSTIIVFASDENPEPKGAMPEFCSEHHLVDCYFCDPPSKSNSSY